MQLIKYFKELLVTTETKTQVSEVTEIYEPIEELLIEEARDFPENDYCNCMRDDLG